MYNEQLEVQPIVFITFYFIKTVNIRLVSVFYTSSGGHVVKSISAPISFVRSRKPPWWPLHFTWKCNYIYWRKYCMYSKGSDNVARRCIMVPQVGSVHAVVHRLKLYTSAGTMLFSNAARLWSLSRRRLEKDSGVGWALTLSTCRWGGGRRSSVRRRSLQKSEGLHCVRGWQPGRKTPTALIYDFKFTALSFRQK